jgi:hypothetical protein
MRTSFVAYVAALSIAFAGCGGGGSAPKNREPVFQVKGKVTYKGQPVAGADIAFKSKSVERTAFGRTDEDGEFQLSTFGTNDGAVAGNHDVIITKSSAAAPTTPEAPVESAEYVPPGFEKVKLAAKKAEPGIPAKYGKYETSGLVGIVNGDGAPNEANFELKD